MITQVQLGSNILTGSQVFVTALRNAAFPMTHYARANRGAYQGSKISASNFSGYKIVIDWIILGSSFSDFATQRVNFIKNIGQINSQGAQTLILTKSDGTSVQIEVKAVNVTGDLDTEGTVAGQFTTEMEAEYPLFQSTTLASKQVFIFNGGGFAIPFGIPTNMGVGTANSLSISNNGNYAAYPIITLVGKLTNPTLTNATTGKQISLNYSLADNTQSIVIDCYERTVVLQPSGNNGRQYASGDFFTIPQGASVLTLGNANNSDGGYALVTYRDSYLGV